MSKQKLTGHELIERKASDIIQNAAEALGMLETIDNAAHETEKLIPEHILWAIRGIYRLVDNTLEAAACVTDTSEEMRWKKAGDHV